MENKKQHMIPCVDHLGNKYCSIKDMCRSYGINTATYRQRIARGWDIEKALTYFPIESRVKCVDHLGNKYASKTEMCSKYGIPGSYNKRIKKGLSVEQALTTPTKHRNINKYIDPVTLEGHDDLKYYIDKYNLPYTTTKNLRNYIQWYNIIRAVGISFILRKGTNNFNVTKYDLTVVKRIKKGKDVFECYINNPDGSKTFRIMSYDMIDEYCLNRYKEEINNTSEK